MSSGETKEFEKDVLIGLSSSLLLLVLMGISGVDLDDCGNENMNDLVGGGVRDNFSQLGFVS